MKLLIKNGLFHSTLYFVTISVVAAAVVVFFLNIPATCDALQDCGCLTWLEVASVQLGRELGGVVR